MTQTYSQDFTHAYADNLPATEHCRCSYSTHSKLKYLNFIQGSNSVSLVMFNYIPLAKHHHYLPVTLDNKCHTEWRDMSWACLHLWTLHFLCPSSCENTTMSSGLNQLDIETGFHEIYKPLGPVLVAPLLHLCTTFHRTLCFAQSHNVNAWQWGGLINEVTQVTFKTYI